MAERRVRKTRKDSDGDITALCNSTEYWSPQYKSSAISDIENNRHTYYVQDSGGRSNVHVVNGPNGKYLRTDPNGNANANLDTLPDC
jgi:hypothetical protein